MSKSKKGIGIVSPEESADTSSSVVKVGGWFWKFIKGILAQFMIVITVVPLLFLFGAVVIFLLDTSFADIVTQLKEIEIPL